jgi:hypothetical protein
VRGIVPLQDSVGIEKAAPKTFASRMSRLTFSGESLEINYSTSAAPTERLRFLAVCAVSRKLPARRADGIL